MQGMMPSGGITWCEIIAACPSSTQSCKRRGSTHVDHLVLQYIISCIGAASTSLESAKSPLPPDTSTMAMWLVERVLGLGQDAALAIPTSAISFTEGKICYNAKMLICMYRWSHA